MTADLDVFVIGAGGHAKVVLSTLEVSGYRVRGLFDDDPKKWGTTVLNVSVLGSTEEVGKNKNSRFVIGVGDNAARKAIALRFGGIRWAAVIHPSAYVHPSVRIGHGSVVFAGSAIQPDTTVGSHCVINTLASVDHDCILGDYVHIAPGANLAGGVSLGEGVLVGVGSVVIPNVSVGSWSVVGAGAVVTQKLMPGVLAVGVPANSIRKRRSS
jgi:sugar O-acyltransferase (sialic acid O-acetyltransferase NeuD family)